MGMLGSVCLVVVASFGASGGSYGAAATPAEMEQARAWAASAFSAASPAFSFSYDGRASSELLAGWTVNAEESGRQGGGTNRVVTFTDPETRLEIRCASIVYGDFPAVEWVLTLSNTGDTDTPILDSIRPLDWQAPWYTDGAIVHYSLGDSNDEKSFAPQTQCLPPNTAAPFMLAPAAGRSSEGYMPFFNVAGQGRGVAMAVGWSGQWETAFDYPDGKNLRVRSGMQTTHLILHPGETIRTPRMLFVFWDGAEPLRGNNLLRQVLIAHYLPRRNGELVLAPICASTVTVDPDGSYEGPHVRPMAPYARRGIEVFWSDMDPQQWYPDGFPEGTGTWEPDPVKYPHGLKPVGDAAHAAGIQYLLWFEPERAAKGSRIAREHPDWVTGGEGGGLFKLHIPEARAWLTDYIDAQVTAAQIDWMRWDFNMQPLSSWKKNDEPNRQGITEIRHIEGLYAMWDEYRTRHPGLVIDLCASGGRRIDLESLTRGLPLWHSDMPCLAKPKPSADQLQNSGLFRWVPLHAGGMFELEPSYGFRSNMTTGNILVPSITESAQSEAAPAPDDPVVRTVAIYKKLRPYMVGDFYPLFPHDASESVWYGYQFHRADLNQGMAMIFRREQCAETETEVHLKELEPERIYEVSTEDVPGVTTMSGAELAAYRAKAPMAASAVILYYKAK